MNTKYIPYSETGFFSNLILDYLSGKEELKPFYEDAPKLSSFARKINDRNVKPVDRELLVAVLLEQNKGLENNKKVLANIELLKSDKTFTVTTGHQLNLFTGPLYFIYKIISTINLAEKLKQEYPANDFIPVYWMHAEDHDFAEINHIHVFGKRVEWQEEHNGPAGEISTASLATVIDELAVIAGENENAKQWIVLLKQAYLNHNNLADAHRYLVHQLFGNYGMVILDARDSRLKKTFVPQLKADIFDNSNHAVVAESNAALEKQGYKVQVNPREINCFYFAEGKRERIVKNEERYDVINTAVSFSKEELEKEIEQQPEKFSPNVVLRPLYQEHILPNLAYIGGAGELAYWMQYKAMFDAACVSFPLLVLRNSVMVVDEIQKSKIKKLGLNATNFFDAEDQLISEYVAAHSTAETSLADEKKKLEELFAEAKSKGAAVDATLEASIEAELQKQLKSLEQVESRIQRAEKKKHETAVNQLKAVREKLFPNNSLQERHDNITAFYLRYGTAFIQALKDNLDPMDARYVMLEE